MPTLPAWPAWRARRYASALAAALLLSVSAPPAAAQREQADPSGLPRVAEAQVQRWASRYLSENKPALERAIQRAQPWAPMIAMKLRAAGLPGALVYLPVIESGYWPWARSPAGAVGLWQFMPGTARDYGLRITPWLDERRDPFKATDAAIRYLRDLYREHGDWMAALASYNAGSGRVRRAVRVAGGSYWAAQGALPRETQHYVPQLLAVARVGAAPERNGIYVPRDYQRPELVRVPLPPATRLRTVARVWGVPLATIAEWNPALTVAATPPGEVYAVVLPASDALTKRDSLLALPAEDRQLTPREIAAMRASP